MAPVLPVRRHGCRRRRARLLQTATRRGSCASTTLASTGGTVVYLVQFSYNTVSTSVHENTGSTIGLVEANGCVLRLKLNCIHIAPVMGSRTRTCGDVLAERNPFSRQSREEEEVAKIE